MALNKSNTLTFSHRVGNKDDAKVYRSLIIKVLKTFAILHAGSAHQNASRYSPGLDGTNPFSLRRWLRGTLPSDTSHTIFAVHFGRQSVSPAWLTYLTTLPRSLR